MFRVLIVDDDIATVDVIRDSADWAGADIDEVYTACNVTEAKEVIAEQHPDIIISDIEMPGENGLDLLRWVRQCGIRCEFLLLTCHEDFTYAASAISHDVAAYLTKPFDAGVMEMNLQRVTKKLQMNRMLEEQSQYGAWMQTNMRVIRLDFWKQLINDELRNETAWLQQELTRRHLDLKADARYRFVYTKVSNAEEDAERYGRNLLEFILEGFHSEILSGQVVNDSVIKPGGSEMTSFLTISEEGSCAGGAQEQRTELVLRCQKLIDTCRVHFKATVTCCISEPYLMREMSEARKRVEQLFNYNISSLGSTFLEAEAQIPEQSQLQILNLERLTTMVEQKEKTGVMRYIRSMFRELTGHGNLNVYSLYLMKQELIQVVYADLARHGIQATRLFYDELSIRIAEKAVSSTVDMIRWVSFLLDRTFAYEEEIQKSHTVIDKINEYIHANYMNDIGRNEIAGEFYLTPEYLAKLYKKKTGVTLKEYINKYRVEQAKRLLLEEGRNVSDVAGAVGFDNFSYFSTVFRKYTGKTPKEYRSSDRNS